MGINVYPAPSAASGVPAGSSRVVDEFTSLNTPVPTSVTRNVSVPAGGLSVYSSVGGVFNFGSRSVTAAPGTPTRIDNPTAAASYTANLGLQMSGLTWRNNPNATVLTANDGSSTATWIDGSNSPYGFSRIAFGNNVWAIFSDNNNYYTSTDGITWTSRTKPASNYGRIAFAGGFFYLFITQGGSGSATVYTSTDAITWTARTWPASQNWSTPALGSGTNYVSIGMAEIFTSSTAPGASNVTAVSTDGVTFTAGGNLPSSSVWGQPAANSAGRVVVSAIYDTNGASATATSKAAYSTNNGASWTASTLPTTGNWMGVLYFNNLFIAVLRTTSTYATSTDGITWTSRTIPGNTNYGSARAIWIGNNGSVPVLYRLGNSNTSQAVSWSTDGINWTTPTDVANAVYAGTAIAPVLAASNGGIAYGNNIHIGAPNASLNSYTPNVSTFTPATIGVYAGSATTI